MRSTRCTSGYRATSAAAVAARSSGASLEMKARISTRSSTVFKASRMLMATRANKPNANSEKAIVVMLRRLSRGARRKTARSDAKALIAYSSTVMREGVGGGSGSLQGKAGGLGCGAGLEQAKILEDDAEPAAEVSHLAALQAQ